MDERLLTERLITYDTSTADGIRAAAGFVKGWLEARDIRVSDAVHKGLPVIIAEVGPAGEAAPRVVFHGHVDVVPAPRRPVRAARRGRPADRPRRLRHEGRPGRDDARAARRRATRARSTSDSSVFPTRSPTTSSRARSTRSWPASWATPGSPSPASRPTCTSASRPRACWPCASRSTARRARLDAVGGRQRDPQGLRRVPAHRDAAVQPHELRPVRPPVDQPRADHGRRRLQQGPRLLRDGRRHPLPAQPGRRRDPGPDARDPRHGDRPLLHARAGDRLAPQPLRAGPARRRRPRRGGRRAVDRARRRLRRGLLPARGHPGGRVRPDRRRPPRPRRVGVDQLAGPLPPGAGHLRPRAPRALAARRAIAAARSTGTRSGRSSPTKGSTLVGGSPSRWRPTRTSRASRRAPGGA